MSPTSALAQQLQIPYEGKDASFAAGLPDAFRKLYFQLYTNSKASRAERIIEDLALLLLLKLSVEVNGGAKVLERYKNGGGSANQVLIPLLKKAYPGLVGARQTLASKTKQ